jgi:hypothetical protein
MWTTGNILASSSTSGSHTPEQSFTNEYIIPTNAIL